MFAYQLRQAKSRHNTRNIFERRHQHYVRLSSSFRWHVLAAARAVMASNEGCLDTSSRSLHSLAPCLLDAGVHTARTLGNEKTVGSHLR
jgi:hypothetical protein